MERNDARSSPRHATLSSPRHHVVFDKFRTLPDTLQGLVVAGVPGLSALVIVLIDDLSRSSTVADGRRAHASPRPYTFRLLGPVVFRSFPNLPS